MSSQATPNDVRLTLDDRGAVLERRPAVARPRHLEDAGSSLDAFHPKALAELPPRSQIRDELGDSRKEDSLLGWSEPLEVSVESRQPTERRQRSGPPTALLLGLRDGSQCFDHLLA